MIDCAGTRVNLIARRAALALIIPLALSATAAAFQGAPPAPPKDGAAPSDRANPKQDAPPKGATKESPLKASINTLEGKPADLSQYEGKVVLFVNVASKCGYTPQYTKLEQLHQRFKDRGLVVIGVPSNDFGGQEPGSSQEIRDFCTKNYKVTFPLLEKSVTKAGKDQSELYSILGARTQKLPTWNFCKYLVARDGTTVTFHASAVDPDSPEFVKEIETALGQPVPKKG